MDGNNSSVFFNNKGKLSSLKKHSIMGIINVCSDSFYKNSQFNELKTVLKQCEQMIKDGADFIDIGAVSSKPGSKYPGNEEEIHRLMAFFPTLRRTFPEILFSIDTWNAEVARKMLEEGANIINDISAGIFDENLPDIISHYHCPYIIMHTSSFPDNMNEHTDYEDIVRDINIFFAKRINLFHQKGICDIIIDPGFGFGKTIEQNYTILKDLEIFKFHGLPILAGISRKSMLYKMLQIKPEEALNATSVVNTIALMNGVNILRVHDVKEAVEVVKIVEMISK